MGAGDSHGADVRIQGYPNPGEGLRLHLNENTGGCSPRVIEAIARLNPADISAYPDYTRAVLGCARLLGVDPGWVLLTNGLDEGILMAAIGHIARPRVHDAESIVILPAFDPYPNSTVAAGGQVVRVMPEADLSFPVTRVIDAITPRTRMVFLNTPNNPTGQLIPLADLERIATAAPHAVVFIDEAYIEFGGDSFLPRLERFPNVLLGRTFSKAYGLAGMRIGVVIGQGAVLDPVRDVTLPFNINGIALAALEAAIADTDFLPRYAAAVHESRERLYAACQRLGLEFWRSAANYVLVRVGDAAPYLDALARRRIHVRDRSKDAITPGCLRITTGIVEHTELAIEALESVHAARVSR
jgi:histidinol-phosphate aminotransferase